MFANLRLSRHPKIFLENKVKIKLTYRNLMEKKFSEGCGKKDFKTGIVKELAGFLHYDKSF